MWFCWVLPYSVSGSVNVLSVWLWRHLKIFIIVIYRNEYQYMEHSITIPRYVWYNLWVFHDEVLPCPSRNGLQVRGWKDQSSRCWAVRPAEKCESGRTDLPLSAAEKAKLLFLEPSFVTTCSASAAPRYKSSVLKRRCGGTAAAKEETEHCTICFLASCIPFFFWVFGQNY